MKFPCLRWMILGILACCLDLPAQTIDTPIFEQGPSGKDKESKRVVSETMRLRKELPLITHDEIEKQLLQPKPEKVTLPIPRTTAMSTEHVAAAARVSSLRVGYCYQCPRCDEWHVLLAGGYAIAEDVIVTCDHVVATKTKMRKGYLMAIDHEGKVAGVTSILARSPAMDTAILRVAGTRFTPVPLNDDVGQGSSSHCFSQPLGQRGYFSTGIVNRFFWNEKYRDENKESIDALRHLRVNFSNDWAPGSSGAPLLDQAGNVIGHVSTIAGIGGKKGGATYLTLHTGIPARSVRSLVQTMADPAQIARLAKLDSQSEAAPDKDAALPEKGIQEPAPAVD